MESVLTGLRAVAEPTRLRLLGLCAKGEINVSDLVQILGISQPRVSRHLKVMCDAGLVERIPEGSWVFYRLAATGAGSAVAKAVNALLNRPEAELGLAALDQERLAVLVRKRADLAAAYFRDHASEWDDLRSLFGSDDQVEETILKQFAGRAISDLIDIGTGTGRLLEKLAPCASHAVGVDLSREMLAVARANLDTAGIRNAEVRHADMYALPFSANSFDAATIYQVLHFAESPPAVIGEAARVLRPGARLVIADLAPHQREDLRESHNHRRLGFSESEVRAWCNDVGLAVSQILDLPGQHLTVRIWVTERT